MPNNRCLRQLDHKREGPNPHYEHIVCIAVTSFLLICLTPRYANRVLSLREDTNKV